MASVAGTRERQPLVPYPLRFLRLTALAAALSGIMFGGFAANAALTPETALVCWALLNGLFVLLLRHLLAEHWRQKAALDRLLDQSADEGVEEERENDVATMVDRLSRDLAAERAKARGGEAALRAILDSLELPILTFDAERRLLFLNLSAKELFGTGLEGRDFSAAMRNPDILDAVDAAIEDLASQEVEFPIYAPVQRRLRARIDPLPALPGQPSTFVTMVDDVTDSKRMQEMRSDFVADVSHELRTPLASVLGIVETLQGPARADEAARDRFLDILKEQSQRMARLVDDLLSLSRIELHEHTAPRGVADLAQVLRSVAEAVAVTAEGREMEIRPEFPDRLDVVGDRDELSRLFLNLVDNAVKYGDRGTVVRVVGTAGERMARVEVIDRGAGIPQEHIPRLTERFYRVDKGRSRAAGGTGLGLAIVKHVVNRHRGQLRIVSEEGLGTTVTVELPLAPG